MAELFANSGIPDQMSRSVASDLGLHCLLVTLLRVSRLQWVIVCFRSVFPVFIRTKIGQNVQFRQFCSKFQQNFIV